MSVASTWTPTNMRASVQDEAEDQGATSGQTEVPAPRGAISIHVVKTESYYSFMALIKEPSSDTPKLLWGHVPFTSRPYIENSLEDCRRQWSERTQDVLGKKGPLMRSWSLASDSVEAGVVMKCVVPELARAGRIAFDKIFYAKSGLRQGFMPEIGQAIEQALRERWPIRVQRDHLTIPWNLLYLGDVPTASNPFDAERFLGIGAELLETDPDIVGPTVNGERIARAVFHHDARLERGAPPAPVTGPVIEETRRTIADVQLRTTVDELEEGIDAHGLDFDLIYLCGHGAMKGNTLTLKLTGERTFSPTNLLDRFSIRGEDQFLPRGPIVIVNVCGSARSQPSDFVNFARAFLQLRARAVLATLADVPAATASEFSRRFVAQVQTHRIDPAIAAARIRRELLLCHNNPCGLLYSAYFPNRDWPTQGFDLSDPCRGET